MQHLEKLIEHAFDNRAQGFANRDEIEAAVNEAVALLDSGKARVAERGESGWQVNQWLKKAVLLSFALAENNLYTLEAFQLYGQRLAENGIIATSRWIMWCSALLTRSRRCTRSSLKSTSSTVQVFLIASRYMSKNCGYRIGRNVRS